MPNTRQKILEFSKDLQGDIEALNTQIDEIDRSIKNQNFRRNELLDERNELERIVKSIDTTEGASSE